MIICEYCQTRLPDDSLFCSQCGQKVHLPGDLSISAKTEPGLASLLPGDTVPADFSETGPTSEPTYSQDNQPVVYPSQPDLPEDSAEIEREILQTYEDIDTNEATTAQYGSAKKKEEEEDDSIPPFLLDVPEPPVSNIPPSQGPLVINNIPSTNPPSIPNALKPHPTHPGETPPLQPHVPTPPGETPPLHPHVSAHAGGTPPLHPHVSAPPSGTPPLHLHVSAPPPGQTSAPHLLQRLLSGLRRRLQTKHLSCLDMALITLAALSLIGVAIIFFGGFSSPSSSQVKLIGATIPGNTIIVHGDQFVPGETVIILVDAHLQVANSGISVQMNAANSVQFMQQNAPGVAVQHVQIVDSDGSFNNSIYIEPTWEKGSHTINVYKQQGQRFVQALHFTLQSAQTGLVGCFDQNSTVILRPLSEHSNEHSTQTISICSQGSGQVHWNANWNQPWLQLAHTGTIQAPDESRITLNATAQNLSARQYTATITFTSQENTAQVVLNVLFVVSKAKPGVAPPQRLDCVSSMPQALSFTNVANDHNILSQSLSVSNCGDTGNWSASPGGQPWLGVGSSQGMLTGGNYQNINVTATSADLRPGTYTGGIRLRIGSDTREIPVVFTVNPPRPGGSCLNVDSSSLVFHSIAGGEDPAPQQVQIFNCGVTSSWSAMMLTDDGTQWINMSARGNELKEQTAQTIRISVSGAQFNRSGTHTGSIIFSMGSSVKKVDIIFTVEGTCLKIDQQSLYFEGALDQSASLQKSITLTNCGNIAGHWYASPSTSDGKNWLSTNIANKELAGHGQQRVLINISRDQLQAGVYTGQITFVMGSVTQLLHITLALTPPTPSRDCVAATPGSLAFNIRQGQGSPSPQSVTVFNKCGNTELLSAQFRQDNGERQWLPPKFIAGDEIQGHTVREFTIAPVADQLPGNTTYTGTMTFKIGASSTDMHITLTVLPSPPCMTLSQSAFNITGIQGNSPTTASVTLRNCGEAGRWSVPSPIPTNNATNWISIGSTHQDLNTGDSTQIPIYLDSSKLAHVGSYTATIPFTLTTRSGQTTTQDLSINLNVIRQTPSSGCQITGPVPSFTSTWGQFTTGEQTITLTNCQPGALLTEIDDSNNALLVTPDSETIDNNGKDVVRVRINGAPDDTYTHQYTITLLAGSEALSVPVTWNIHPPSNATCIQAETNQLSLSITQGETRSTSVTFTNCGAYSGSISVTPDSNSQWLTISAGNDTTANGTGSYATGEGASIVVSIDSARLAAGRYKETVTGVITTAQGLQTTPLSVTLDVTKPNTNVAPTSTPTGTSTPTPQPTPTAKPTPTPALTPTPQSTPTAQPTSPPEPTPTPAPEPTAQPTSPPEPTPTSPPGTSMFLLRSLLHNLLVITDITGIRFSFYIP